MPETIFTKASTSGWAGSSRNDLPLRDMDGTTANGALSTKALNPLGAQLGSVPHSSMPAVRQLTYQYVDTGYDAVSVANVLWSDSASWCTIVTLWSMGKAGLAHVVPGATAPRDVTLLLDRFATTPTEIHMVTMPNHFDKADGIISVRNTIRAYYGAKYAGIKVHIMSGYNGKDWEQKHQLAVDPKSGAYPVFN